jgi:hypothetical protein
LFAFASFIPRLRPPSSSEDEEDDEDDEDEDEDDEDEDEDDEDEDEDEEELLELLEPQFFFFFFFPLSFFFAAFFAPAYCVSCDASTNAPNTAAFVAIDALTITLLRLSPLDPHASSSSAPATLSVRETSPPAPRVLISLCPTPRRRLPTTTFAAFAFRPSVRVVVIEDVTATRRIIIIVDIVVD